MTADMAAAQDARRVGTLVEVVVPSIGRPSLQAALAPLVGRIPVVVVDDRPSGAPLSVPDGVRVVRSGGRGPAAARNAGWRASDAEWIAFVDDDVLPPEGWVQALLADLDRCAPDVGGTQGRLRVPLPAGRRPSDWERSTAGLETARWATADLAYRRRALEQVGGFDERFPRAYREDADLGLRVTQAGWRIVRGQRSLDHPVRPAPWRQSIRSQRGNADDVLMRGLHGPRWRELAGVPAGRRPWHLVTTAALATAIGAGALGHRRTATVAGAAWLGLTADFAARRIAAGPRTSHEVAAMTVSSAAIPVVATGCWLTGWLRLRRLLAAGGPTPVPPAPAAPPVPSAPTPVVIGT